MDGLWKITLLVLLLCALGANEAHAQARSAQEVSAERDPKLVEKMRAELEEYEQILHKCF